MPEQEQNRSEPATPHKLEEARKQGQVAKSLDLNSFALVAALLAILVLRSRAIAGELAELWTWLLQSAGSLRLEQQDDVSWLGYVLAACTDLVLPFALTGVILAIASNIVQIGPVFTFAPLRPKFERVNPIAGFKRLFNKRMLFEAFKTLLKLLLFGFILYGFFMTVWPLLPAAGSADAGTQTSWLGRWGSSMLTRLAIAMLGIALLDVVFVRWQYSQQMMMSRRELREEIKRREGDPHVRAKIRELQKENLKQAGSLSRVPEADVLITNPEHFAVALRYVRGEMAAPHVIAKGSDAWAAELRALARKHGIPIYERRALARRLFRHAQLDRPIPPESYTDVARVYGELEADKRRRARYEVPS